MCQRRSHDGRVEPVNVPGVQAPVSSHDSSALGEDSLGPSDLVRQVRGPRQLVIEEDAKVLDDLLTWDGDPVQCEVSLPPVSPEREYYIQRFRGVNPKSISSAPGIRRQKSVFSIAANSAWVEAR